MNRNMNWKRSNSNRERRNAYRVLVRRPEGKSYVENLGLDGKIILKGLKNK
jgi:hypothetical protein